MKINRTVMLIALALLLLWLFTLLPSAAAQGNVPPTPPPPVTPVPPVNPVDAANARADQWQAVANQAVNDAQTSLNYAYGALANAQAGLYQAQLALQQERAARLAAQQGQIQQAVEAAQASQLAATNAVASMSASTNAAMESMRMSSAAMREVMELKATLTVVTAQRDAARSDVVQLDKDRTALAGELVAERSRSDLFSKITVALFLLLALLMSYIALVLLKVARQLRPAQRDRMVVVDECGQVRAQIEALS